MENTVSKARLDLLLVHAHEVWNLTSVLDTDECQHKRKGQRCTKANCPDTHHIANELLILFQLGAVFNAMASCAINVALVQLRNYRPDISALFRYPSTHTSLNCAIGSQRSFLQHDRDRTRIVPDVFTTNMHLSNPRTSSVKDLMRTRSPSGRQCTTLASLQIHLRAVYTKLAADIATNRGEKVIIVAIVPAEIARSQPTGR